MSAKSTKTFAVALAGAALMTIPAPAAFAQSVSGVTVNARAPTEVRIPLAGKAKAHVYGEIRVAARTVCRNAVANREMSFIDLMDCRLDTAATARRTYARIVAHHTQFAEAPTIVLSAR